MRNGKIVRKTKETDIEVLLNLDGTGKNNIETGIGFFDHMLTQISVHGNIDLNVKAVGDLHVDGHHTIEDVGISLGLAIKEALKEKKNIVRYGQAIVPMDEALVLCAIDICNRPYVNIATPFKMEMAGEFPTDMTEEFFKAIALNAGINIQTIVYRGNNTHHIIEGTFKAFAKALKMAVSITNNDNSSKGVL